MYLLTSPYMLQVVLDKGYLDNPTEVAHRCWLKSNKSIAPNGSLMRTHPLGIVCLGLTLSETFKVALNYSIITHADPRCVVACCISTGLIRGILRGEVLNEGHIDEMIEDARVWVDAWLRRGRAHEKVDKPGEERQHDEEEPLGQAELEKHVQAKRFEELQLDDSAKMGYVYKALGAAILALRLGMRQSRSSWRGQVATDPTPTPATARPNSTIFEEIMTSLVFEAGDADTNACVAGALLGCWFGYNSLPAHWRDGIEHHDWLVQKCEALSQVMGVSNDMPGYKGSADLDTCIDGGKGLMSREELKARGEAFTAQYVERQAKGMQLANQREKEKKRKEQKGWTRMPSWLGRQ